MGVENRVIVSFHKVGARDLIEERPGPAGKGSTKRSYVSRRSPAAWCRHYASVVGLRGGGLLHAAILPQAWS